MKLLKQIKHQNLKSLLIGVGVAWGVASISAVSAGTIAQVPLFISATLDPNILFILDDSGSMEWSYLPDSTSSLRDTKRGKSAAINSAYYDPTITYIPPVDQNGTSLGNASFNLAWKNGYKFPLTGTGGRDDTRVNLSTSFRPTWDNPTNYADAVVPGTTTGPAYYYQFSPGTTVCPGAGNINTESCYVKKTINLTSTAAEQQNFANWYSYYRTRLMMAKAGISRGFSQLGNTPRVGYGRINQSISTTVDGISINTVERGVRAFSGTARKDFFDWLFARTAANATPLRRALNSAGFYYSNQGSSGPWSSTPGVSGGELLACRPSYTVLMTDGYWNDAAAGTAAAQSNNDGTTANNMTISDPSGSTFSYQAVAPFTDTFSNTLADVAMYYWKRDLCPSIDNKVPTTLTDPAFWQHMVTYGIGLGVPTTIDPTAAFSAITNKSSVAWPNPNTANPASTSVARIDDLLHATVNSRGKFFSAKNPDQFATALSVTLSGIVNDKASSASAVAANSTRLDAGTQVYQAIFTPLSWSGDLKAYHIDLDTGDLTSNWNASEKLPDHPSRNILTYNPAAAAGLRGISFQWANLTCPGPSSSTCLSLNIQAGGISQQDYLNTLASVNDGNGALRVNWLRGDRTNEKINDGDTLPTHIFRTRISVLGDIINSDPVYVGQEDYGYAALSGTEGTNYIQFRTSSAYTARRPMLYVGANDGMLHGFDAANSASGGAEVVAYIPNAIFPELSKLTSPAYSHRYYVDGMSAVGDVYDPSIPSPSWRTVLAGTTGAGARAVFALDVTNPDAFGASSALWEFTSATPTYGADLGYTLAQPSVVRMQDGHWAVIVANGYESNNGHAVLFVLDAKTGTVLQKIDTGAGNTTNKNGLSAPIAIDTNNDHSVDTVYAGDLYGNLWKFDVSGSAGSWPVPSSPFFVACTTSGATCSAANRQPITGKPNVGKAGGAGTDQNGVGRMIYFGTGKYFETSDNIIGASPQVQTFYGLWDKGSAVTDRALLQEQSIDFEGFAPTVLGIQSTKSIRVVSKKPVCYAATSIGCTSGSSFKSGWALNLLNPSNPLKTPPKSAAEGERVVSTPLLRRGLVVFSTVIPNPDPCNFGGQSRLMEVDALMGGEFGASAFDVNGDGMVNGDDIIITPDGIKHTASGTDLGIGVTKTPAIVESTNVDYKYLSGSTGQIGKIVDLGGGGCVGAGCASSSAGIRRSWRQLK